MHGFFAMASRQAKIVRDIIIRIRPTDEKAGPPQSGREATEDPEGNQAVIVGAKFFSFHGSVKVRA